VKPERPRRRTNPLPGGGVWGVACEMAGSHLAPEKELWLIRFSSGEGNSLKKRGDVRVFKEKTAGRRKEHPLATNARGSGRRPRPPQSPYRKNQAAVCLGEVSGGGRNRDSGQTSTSWRFIVGSAGDNGNIHACCKARLVD